MLKKYVNATMDRFGNPQHKAFFEQSNAANAHMVAGIMQMATPKQKTILCKPCRIGRMTLVSWQPRRFDGQHFCYLFKYGESKWSRKTRFVSGMTVPPLMRQSFMR